MTNLCDSKTEIFRWPINTSVKFHTTETVQASAFEIACEACPTKCDNCTVSNPYDVQLCEPVMEHTASVTLDGTLETLDLAPGFWRSSNISTEIRECYEADSCVGGTKNVCADGYDGPCEYQLPALDRNTVGTS